MDLAFDVARQEHVGVVVELGAVDGVVGFVAEELVEGVGDEFFVEAGYGFSGHGGSPREVW